MAARWLVSSTSIFCSNSKNRNEDEDGRVLSAKTSTQQDDASLVSSLVEYIADFHKGFQQQAMAARSLVSTQRFCSYTQNSDALTDDRTLSAQMKSSQSNVFSGLVAPRIYLRVFTNTNNVSSWLLGRWVSYTSVLCSSIQKVGIEVG